MSPLRTSLDLSGFPRLRSRSEVDTSLRAEKLRVARRKFEERERVKEEKYDREMIRKRERRDTKEACRIEKGEAVTPGTGTGSGNTGVGGRPGGPRRRITPTMGLGLVMSSASSSAGPSSGGGAVGGKGSRGELAATSDGAGAGRSSPFGAASAPAPAGTSTGIGIGLGIGRRRHTDSPMATTTEMAEKQQMGFASRKYENVTLDAPPVFGPGPAGVEDVRFAQMGPRRGSGAKRKTQGYWQGFILWLRTKLLRLGGN
jgi:hypothetical protein